MQQMFLEHYLQSWNATEAAKAAGYAHPGQQGHRLLKNVQIQDEIKVRIGEQAMAAGEVLERLADQARGTADDFLTIEEYPETTIEADDEGKLIYMETGKTLKRAILDLPKAAERGKLHLIKKMSETKYGLSVELYDAQAALVHLGKHHGLFTDNVKVDIDVTQLSDEELAALAEGKGGART